MVGALEKGIERHVSLQSWLPKTVPQKKICKLYPLILSLALALSGPYQTQIAL